MRGAFRFWGFVGVAIVSIACAVPSKAGAQGLVGATGGERGLFATGAAATASNRAGSGRSASALSATPALPRFSERLRSAGNAVLQAADFRSRLTGFGTSGGSSVVLPYGLGRRDEDAGTSGVGFRFAPTPEIMRRLAVETAYLDRRSESPYPQAATTRDDVWSVALIGRSLDERLSLHSEYAVSRSMAVARGRRAALNNGAAYSIGASYRGNPVALGPSPLRWRLAVDRKHAEPSFWTLANGDLPRGATRNRLSSVLDWSAIETRLSYATSADDPSQGGGAWRRHTFNAELASSGSGLGWLPVLGRFLGEPHYAVALQRERRARRGATEAPAVMHANRTAVRLRFDPGWWDWGLRHVRSRSFAERRAEVGSANYLTAIHIDLPFDRRFSIRSELRWNAIHDYGGANATATLAGILGGSATLVPDELNAEFRLSANRRLATSGAVDERVIGLESGVDWTLPRHWVSPSRVTLSLDGRYEYADNAATAAGSQARYKAFASLEINWPGGG